MRLAVFASGSTGNCALVRGGGRSVLLDAGISAKRIRAGLESLDTDPAGLDGVLVTHEHADHVSGLRVFTKQFPTPVYAPGPVAEALGRSVPELVPMLRELEPERPFSLGCMTVTCFPTPHDAVSSVGYRIEADGAVFVSATDTGCVTDTMLRYFSGADTALIEANHDIAMLRNGPYPAYLKRRILSERGHLSNDECTWLAAVLAEQGTGKIVLGHISKNNNVPGLARRTVYRALEGRETELFLAPESGCLQVEVASCFV